MRTVKIYQEPKLYITKTTEFLNSYKRMIATQLNVLNVILAYTEVNGTFKYVELEYKQIADIIGVRNTKIFRDAIAEHFPPDIEQPNRIRFEDLFNPIEVIGKNTIRFYFTELAFDSFVRIPNFEGE